MLWIGGQLTTMTIIKTLIVPSIVAMMVPLTVLSFTMKGEIVRPVEVGNEDRFDPTTAFERNLIFF